MAAKYGNTAAITALAEAGADLTIRDSLGYTPAETTILADQKESLLALAEAGVDLNASTNLMDQRLIHFAARYGNIAITDTLIKAGVDINAKSNCGETPAHAAAGNGHRGVLVALAKAGADLNAKDEHGETPAHAAANKRHRGVLVALAEAGADLNAKDEHGETPAAKAVMGWKRNNGGPPSSYYKTYNEVFTFLEENVPPISSRLEVRGIGESDARTIEALIEEGVSIDIRDVYGRTPAYIAAQNGNIAGIEALAKADADLNTAEYARGYTPAHAAVIYNHPTAIGALAKAGADLNAFCKDGLTPAHIAASSRQIDAIQALADAGADLNAKDRHGKTPADIAAINGFHDLANFIERHIRETRSHSSKVEKTTTAPVAGIDVEEVAIEVDASTIGIAAELPPTVESLAPKLEAISAGAQEPTTEASLQLPLQLVMAGIHLASGGRVKFPSSSTMCSAVIAPEKPTPVALSTGGDMKDQCFNPEALPPFTAAEEEELLSYAASVVSQRQAQEGNSVRAR